MRSAPGWRAAFDELLHAKEQKECNARGKAFDRDLATCTDTPLSSWGGTRAGLAARLDACAFKDETQVEYAAAFLGAVDAHIEEENTVPVPPTLRRLYRIDPATGAVTTL